MTEQQQIKNIISFLCIICGGSYIWEEILMNFSPEYIIEKFNQYIESTKYESDWGLHPSLRRDLFDRYCIKYNIPNSPYCENSEKTDEFSCDGCHLTFKKNNNEEWNDIKAKNEFLEKNPECKDAPMGMLCEECFIKYDEWFKKLTEEDKRKMREIL